MSTAEKKHGKFFGASQLEKIVFASFSDLAASMTPELFSTGWQITPGPDEIVIESGSVSLHLVAPHIWSDMERLSHYKPYLDDPSHCVCLIGQTDEYGRRNFETDDRLQEICLPIGGIHLKLALKNIFQLKAAIVASESKQELISEASRHVKYVLQISRELNGVRDTNRLLSLILTKAREVTHADAGSIYVVDKGDTQDDEGEIVFKITQNETVEQDLDEFRIPISDSSIVGNAVIQGKSINIDDLYALNVDPSKNPYGVRHDRTWDDRIGYQCRSMLTLPMFDISHNVVGVIQLINKKKPEIKHLKGIENFSAYVEPFDPASVEYAEIVAQQAGIALENAMLTKERENLFEGFVHASVTAIEQRDPTTSGHSHRVAQITLQMAGIINRISHGKFSSVHFTKNQLKEIEYASLLHDFGKLGVREQVLTKAKKLFPWELELLLERFDHIRSRIQVNHLEELIRYLEDRSNFPPGFGPETFRKTYEHKLQELDEYLNFILKSNEPTVLEQGGFEKLKDIANLAFRDFHAKDRPFLKNKELEALSVSRGSLTREEFAEIQSHVNHTYEFLRKIPWGRDLSNVPQIAAKHHEKLDGSGYPTSARDQEIPVQTRIMTISDIYDALTASDRPYKKAVPIDRALDILNMEVKAGKLDQDLFNIFVESKVYEIALASQKKKIY